MKVRLFVKYIIAYLGGGFVGLLCWLFMDWVANYIGRL